MIKHFNIIHPGFMGSLGGGLGYQWEPESLNYFSRVASRGGSIISTHQTAFDQLVKGLKAAGEWTKIKELCVFMGGFPGCFVKAKYPAGKSDILTYNNFVAADYATSSGIAGDGTSKYFSTDMIPSDLDNTNMHAIVGSQLFQNNTVAFAPVISSQNGFSYSLTTQGTWEFYAGIGSQIQVTCPINAGLQIFNATSSTLFNYYFEGNIENSTTGSRSALAQTAAITFLKSGSTYCTGNLWVYSFGTAFNSPATVDSLFQTFLSALGRSAVANILFDGDSITFGSGATNGVNYPNETTRKLGLFGKWNRGKVGDTYVNMLSEATTEYANTYKAGNILALSGGNNDISGYTAQQIWDNMVSLVNYGKSLGYTKILVGTPGPYQGATGTTGDNTRLAYIDMLRNNLPSIGVKIMDFMSDSRLSTWSSNYYTDQQHPNSAGYGVMSDIAVAAIQTLL